MLEAPIDAATMAGRAKIPAPIITFIILADRPNTPMVRLNSASGFIIFCWFANGLIRISVLKNEVMENNFFSNKRNRIQMKIQLFCKNFEKNVGFYIFISLKILMQTKNKARLIPIIIRKTSFVFYSFFGFIVKDYCATFKGFSLYEFKNNPVVYIFE